MNYTIAWKYIVEKMDSKFGIPPDSTEEFSMGELESHIEDIWNEFFYELYQKEMKRRRKNE